MSANPWSEAMTEAYWADFLSNLGQESANDLLDLNFDDPREAQRIFGQRIFNEMNSKHMDQNIKLRKEAK